MRLLYGLFNIPHAASPDRAGEPQLAAANDGATGVFITPQSLTSFPGASFGVMLLTTAIGRLVPSAAPSTWLPFGAAAVIGAFIMYMNLSDPRRRKTRRNTVIDVAVGVLNTLYLFAASTGILKVVTSS
jgi:hypothetical protein